jgi:hypothetical protein
VIELKYARRPASCDRVRAVCSRGGSTSGPVSHHARRPCARGRGFAGRAVSDPTRSVSVSSRVSSLSASPLGICAFVVHSIELGLEVLSLPVRSLLRVRITPAAELMIVRSICVSRNVPRPHSGPSAGGRRPRCRTWRPRRCWCWAGPPGRWTASKDASSAPLPMPSRASRARRVQANAGALTGRARRIATPASGHPPPAEAPSCGGLCTP